MVDYNRSGMTSIALIAAVITITSTGQSVCAWPLPPSNISQVEQGKSIRDRGDCLAHQYLDESSLTCRNCTFCSPGTEHSPSERECGNGYGRRTTCSACRKGFYQNNEGYSGLKCLRCETCHPGAKVIQNCTETQNAICGDCPLGTYPYQKNVCLNCENDPDREECVQPTPMHLTLTNQPAPILPSLNMLNSLPPSTPLPDKIAQPSLSPSPTKNISEDNNERGTPTVRFSVNDGVVAVVVILLICVILLAFLRWKKWKPRNGSGGRLPSKQQVATFQTTSCGHINVQTRDNDATACNSGTANATTSNSTTATGQGRLLPTFGNETASDHEVKVALLPEREPRGPATARCENERLQGAGVPVNHPSDLASSSVSTSEYSLPQPLCSNGGRGGDAVYQHLRNNVPGSPDSSSVLEDEEDSLSLPGPLIS